MVGGSKNTMEKEKINSYRDLVVWQKSIRLTVEVYRLAEKFPSSELYGLASQMKRAAVSVPSNIAEGSRRSSRKDYRHFLLIAFGSGSELETQIEVAKNLPFGKSLDYSHVSTLLEEVMRMLNVLVSKLEN